MNDVIPVLVYHSVADDPPQARVRAHRPTPGSTVWAYTALR